MRFDDTSLPEDFLAQLSSHFQTKLVLIERLHARDGLSYKIEDRGKLQLLKLVEVTSTNVQTARRKASLLREAQRLIELPEITGELYLGHGEIGSITWLLRRWIDGVTATDHTSTIRSQPLSLAAKWQFVDDLCQMLKKVIRLDDLGYLHGDLQPRHFIIDAQGTFRLIDLELAVRKDEFEPLYPGALIHFVSPETAREMLVDNQHIPLDPLSEIYSFAAVAFTLYTGQPPTMDGEAKEERVSFEQRLQAIVQGRNKSFAQAGATPFPELEQILLRCLAPEREQRYQTFTALLSAFQSIF